MNLDDTSSKSNSNDLWKELYEICWNLCVKDQWDRERFREILEKTKYTNDRKLVSFVIWLSDYRKKIEYNDKFQWMTSCLFNRKYPPIDCNIVVAPWNQYSGRDYLKHFNSGIREWTALIQSPLNPGVIVQNTLLNDCSLICSLINAKKKNLIKASSCVEAIHFNFHFNGCERLISVPKDSLVPKSLSSSKPISLLSSDLQDQLIELAYFELKNNRCYKHNGSNTASDSFLITGWIPKVLEASLPGVLERARDYWELGSMLAIGTGQTSETEEVEFHDYVVLDVDWKNRKWKILNPQLPNCIVEYSSEEVMERFRWVYINWNPKSKYFHHSKFHCRYIENFNKYATWTQKPVITIENTSSSKQDGLVLLERHLLETQDREQNVVLGEIPNAGFTAVDADGNNLGFCTEHFILEPLESKSFFYHSDIKTNLTFHLFTNSSEIRIVRGKSPVVTLNSEWNISNNEHQLGSAGYYKNPAFRLDVSDAHEGYLDLELISKEPAKVNLQVYRSNDYSFQRPLIEDTQYHTNSMTLHGLAVAPGIQYNIVCSAKEKVESDFILTARSPFKKLCFTIHPISLGYGGLLFHTSVVATKMLKINTDSFTELFVSVYSDNDICDDAPFCILYECETLDILPMEYHSSNNLKKNALVLSNIKMRPGNYILEFQNNKKLLNVNIGSSSRIRYVIPDE